MPLFYNTASPTPNSRNTINSVSIDIRDFLLQKNLLPTYPNLSTSLNGSPRIGEPVLDTETNFLNSYPQQRLEGNTSSLDILGSFLNGQGIGLGNGGSIEPNFDVRGSILGRVLGSTGILNDTKIGTIGAKQLAMALANNAAFNVQQEILGTLNVKENIYSLIKDGDLAGFRPNYRITVPSSTGGQILNGITRVLGFQIPRSYLDESGSIFQSENGDVANIERANSMILNTGKGQVVSLVSNVIENSNVNLSNNPFRSGYTPAYKNNKGDLTIPSGNTKIYAYSNAGNINKILGNSGEIIPELNYNREELTKNSGFESPEDNSISTAGFINSGYDNRTVNSIGFSWTSQNGDAINNVKNLSTLPIPGFIPVDTELKGDKKSLLVKTQKLFNSKGMKSLVTVKGEMGYDSTQISTANNDGISKGSAVLAKGRYDLELGVVNSSGAEASDNFCRTWTTLDRYDKISKLIRNKPLYSDPSVAYRFQTKNSVLDGPFVKIAPYANEIEDPKKFMLSIENLAWKDEFKNLPECEQGPGDLISGERGRIMWFPPYDIQFTENNSVNWEETNFIGRGEPIYTYNNTKRSGTLSFKIIVDHPSYYNAFNAKRNSGGSPDDNYIASFFAGCVDVDTRWAEKLVSKQIIDTIKSSEIETPEKKQSPTNPQRPSVCSVFFPNDVRVYNQDYENGYVSGTTTLIDYLLNPTGEGNGIGYYKADVTQKNVNGLTRTWFDSTNYGLNNGFKGFTTRVNDIEYDGYNDPEWQAAMVDFLKSYPWAVVNVTGYASPQGFQKSNEELANLRADGILEKLKNDWGSQLGLNSTQLEQRFKKTGFEVLSNISDCAVQTKSNPNPPTDTLGCKLSRKVEISIVFDENLKAEQEKALAPTQPKKTYQNTKIRSEIKNNFYTECDYFERLTENDPFVFDSIRQKIRYFHPAFHSTTPEGLNSRLTFLLQCTRQGRTLEDQGANNLAFGRPPVCILRIGDFYNTKIVIDNVNISYEPLVWDLNPEGVGVQPMIANVDITFNFLGGSTLMGPLNKLQNALSFNYFANTHVYDPRADYISKNRPTWNVKDKNGEDLPMSMIAKENPTGYYINDGVSYGDYISTVTKILDETDLGVTDQPLDQVKDEQIVNSGPENNQIEGTPDETIFDNAFLLGQYFIKIENTDDDKLKGVFSVYDSGLSLTKKYKAKIKLLTGMDSIDVSSFIIGEDESKPNIGSFTTERSGWKQILSLSSNKSDDSVYFQVSIEDINQKFGTSYAVARFDCPEYELLPGQLTSINEWKSIMENPCCECYPNGYSSNMTFILNGQECSKISNTGC